jgi:hypothetical protein
LLGLFDPEDVGDMFLSGPGLTFDGLLGVISQKIALSITTAADHKSYIYGWMAKSYENSKIFVVESEVLTSVVMKSSIFWDIMPYSPLKGLYDVISQNT